jgi:hypothetical protein
MRTALISMIGFSVAISSTGCVVRFAEPQPVAEVSVESPTVEVSGPVVEGPGVEVIDVEPDPVERVYVYDPGYPPGTYFYGGYVFYGGYRYPRDVFYDRYVVVNVHEHRFADAEANRRRGVEIERTHRQEFARTGGRRPAEAARNNAARQSAHNNPNAQHMTQEQQRAAAQQQHLQPQQKKPNKKDTKDRE